jgi:single-strand DNA-binding protein
MLNRIILVGRLTRDPELRKTTSGTSIASFSIAVDDSYKQPDGTKNTLFMNCKIFGNRAENVVKFVRKGSLVSVDGRLSSYKYTRKSDNQQMTGFEVVCDGVEFLDPKNAQPAQSGDNGGYTTDKPAPSAPENQAQAKKDSGNLDSIDVVDDDLPF